MSQILQLIIATSLAGLIGLERERQLQKKGFSSFGGFRTFSMMGALGFLAFLLEKGFKINHFLIIVFICTMALVAVSHTFNTFVQKKLGLTSELSLIASFLIGILVAQDKIVLAITISILFVTLLEFKNFLHRLAKNFTEIEFLAILKFLIIAGVILPILPNQNIDPWGIFNPRNIWFMVVLVASIRFVGFFLAKIFGQQKGIIITAIFGGLASSTAVTTSLAQQSKKETNSKSDLTFLSFLIGILFANAIMFLRVFLEVKIVFPFLAQSLAIPLFTMAFSAFLLAGILCLIKTKKIKSKKIITSQPFSLLEALKFGIFFVLVLASAKILPKFLGDMGLFATAMISGLADTDAITLSTANLVKTGDIKFTIAVQVITLAVVVNTLVKIVITLLFGHKRLAFLTFLSFTLIILLGGVSLLFV